MGDVGVSDLQACCSLCLDQRLDLRSETPCRRCAGGVLIDDAPAGRLVGFGEGARSLFDVGVRESRFLRTIAPNKRLYEEHETLLALGQAVQKRDEKSKVTIALALYGSRRMGVSGDEIRAVWRTVDLDQPFRPAAPGAD